MSSTQPRPHSPVLLNGIPFTALVDTGAVCTAISAFALSKIPHPVDGPYPPDSLMGAGTTPLQTLGKYYIDVTLQTSEHLSQERRFVGWPITAIQTLETDVILGTDILEEAGATIDMSSKAVSFKQPQTTIATISSNQQFTLPSNAYTSATTQRYSLLPSGTTMVSLKLMTPPGVAIKEGATVASYCLKQSPIIHLDALHKVRADGTIRALWYNTSPVNTALEVGDSLPGLIFHVVQPKDISKATTLLDSSGKEISILTEVSEPLCPDKKPSSAALTQEKRKYLADNSNLSGIEPHFRRMYKDFIIENQDIFSGSKYDIGLARRYRHRIDTTTNRPQFRMQFKLSPPHQDFLKSTVKDLLEAHAIAPCRSGFNSPVFAVPKQTGKGLRLVQDLRQLNDITQDDRFSILDSRACLNKVGDSKPSVFSSLDLSASFWQLGLDPESQHKTAFTLPFQNKQYKWLVCPMGVMGGPASFSRLMGEVLGHIPGITTYVDDCLISTPCHRSHMVALNAVASQLRRYNLKLNSAKCLMGQREVTFLGHKVDSQGISPAIDKIAAIKAIPPPTSMVELMQTIGLFNFFRGLVPNFARRMSPLHRLTRKDSPWKRGPLPKDALTAFLSMRHALASGPILRYPDFKRPFALFVDAAGGASLSQSDKGGIGALLAQPPSPSSDSFAPISYFSRALRGSERKYSAFDLELLALTEALRHFQEYIAGQNTIVYTDHKPLSDASRASNSKTSMRLTDIIQTFDVTIKYRKGRENGAADALSRSPLPKAVSIMDPVFFPTPPKSTPGLPEKQQADTFIKMVIAARSGVAAKQTNHPQVHLANKVAQNAFMADDLWWITSSSKADKIPDSTARVLAPASMTKHIISSAHDSPLAGHWAKDRTMRKILSGWWWPTIAEDVLHFINACTQCQKAKLSEAQNLHLLTPWPSARRFNSRVHVDLVGPLISSEGPGRYIMSAVDAFSRWTMLTVIPCKTGKATRDAFFTKWICIWSAPETIVSDNGLEFNNKHWQEMAIGAGSKLHFVTPYHPAANGMVERFNRELKDYMRSIVSADTKDWEDFIPTLMLAKNCSYNRHIKTTPFEIVLSSLPNTPWSAPPITRDINFENPTLKQIMRGRQNVNKADKEQRVDAAKCSYDKKHPKDCLFQEGQKVLVHHSTTPAGANRKFFRPWWGPAVVIQALGHGTYLVQEPHRNDGTLSKLHRNRLKHFVQPEPFAVPPIATEARNQEVRDRPPSPRRHQLILTSACKNQENRNRHPDMNQERDSDSSGSELNFHGFGTQEMEESQDFHSPESSTIGEEPIHDEESSTEREEPRLDAQHSYDVTSLHLSGPPTAEQGYEVTSLHLSGPPMAAAQAKSPVQAPLVTPQRTSPQGRAGTTQAQAQNPTSALLGGFIASGLETVVNRLTPSAEATPSRRNPTRDNRISGHFRTSDHKFIPH